MATAADTVLSEKDLLDRLAEVKNDLAAFEDAYGYLILREWREGPNEPGGKADEARAIIAGLKSEEQALGLALAELQRQDDAEEERGRRAVKAADYERAVAERAAMGEAFTALVEGIRALTPHAEAFFHHANEQVNIASAHIGVREGIADIMRALKVDLDRPRKYLEGQLAGALGNFGIGDQQAWRETGRRAPAKELVFMLQASNSILGRLYVADEDAEQ